MSLIYIASSNFQNTMGWAQFQFRALDNLRPFESMLNCLAHSGNHMSALTTKYTTTFKSPKYTQKQTKIQNCILFLVLGICFHNDDLGIYLAINVKHCIITIFVFCFQFIVEIQSSNNMYLGKEQLKNLRSSKFKNCHQYIIYTYTVIVLQYVMTKY